MRNYMERIEIPASSLDMLFLISVVAIFAGIIIVFKSDESIKGKASSFAYAILVCGCIGILKFMSE